MVTEELNQFERNQVQHLVPRLHDRPAIGTKWIFRNKLNESDNVMEYSKLVAQDYTQIHVSIEKTFAPVARLEAIRMTLAFASFKDFKLFQMDVKSAFLNSFIDKEVYVEQPPEFIDPTHLDFGYKLDKALYGLKQAPRAWNERLSTFLILNDIVEGKVDTTL